MFALAKRSREEDEGELDELRADRKKPRTLPFRTSPTTKHTCFFSQSRQILRPPVLTPAESSEDESDHEPSRRGIRLGAHLTLSSLQSVDDASSDLDMEDSEPLGSPLWTPRLPTYPSSAAACRNQPATPKSMTQIRQLSISNTRIPTPIYGHFNISAQDTMMDTAGMGSITETPEVFGKEHNSQNDLFIRRRRRLPSPISEDENMDSPMTTTGSMLHNIDMGAVSTNQYLHSTITTPITPPEEHAFLGSARQGSRRGALDGQVKGFSHALNGPEGKVIFTMGFRADCEKCRSRVPGHYSHVLRV